MCRHPFPFELLAQGRGDLQHVSHAVLGADRRNGGSASRPSLASLKSRVLASHTLPKLLAPLPIGYLARLFRRAGAL